MSPGRIATYLGILLLALGLAGLLERRVAASRRRAPAASGPAPAIQASPIHEPRTSPAPSREGPLPPAPPPPLPGSGGTIDRFDGAGVDPRTDALCPAGMVLVDATPCAVAAKRCARADPGRPAACLEYAPAACGRAPGMRFCVDRDEYPNRPAMLPAAMVTLDQSRAACEGEDKRLCGDREWTLACEGPLGLGFPYGEARIPGACNTGGRDPRLRPSDLWGPVGVADLVARVDGRRPSGASHACVSPFGVRDLVGNVEEWVEGPVPGAGALRGGEYTGEPGCRAIRTTRQPGFRLQHTGFRCCRDPLVSPPRRPESAASGPRPVLPQRIAPQGPFD